MSETPNEYAPNTEEIRDFDRWLVTNEAKITRLARRIRPAEEPKWEYGIRDESSCVRVVMWGPNRERIESQMYRWAGSTLVKRVIAGEWEPTEQDGA